MTFKDLAHIARSQDAKLDSAPATGVIAAVIAVLFAGSTVLTPLYVIYQQQFGFSQITLTLIYAVYVIGNLTALLLFGRLSDEIGRRRVAVPAIAVAIIRR
jgi:MFS family permease